MREPSENLVPDAIPNPVFRLERRDEQPYPSFTLTVYPTIGVGLPNTPMYCEVEIDFAFTGIEVTRDELPVSDPEGFGPAFFPIGNTRFAFPGFRVRDVRIVGVKTEEEMERMRIDDKLAALYERG